MLHADVGPEARPPSKPEDALGPTLYERIADRIAPSIRAGVLVPGQRIPSVRRASEQFGVSVTTVLEAYRRLEDRGLIEARPQSGYYVRRAPDPPPAPARTDTNESATELTVSELVLRVIQDWRAPGLVANLGTAAPSPGIVPVDAPRSHARARAAPARAARRSPTTARPASRSCGYRSPAERSTSG